MPPSGDTGRVNLDNVVISPGTQGLITALVALQQANGVDFDTAVARVHATAESSAVLFRDVPWADLVDMLRWFAAPPTPGG